MDPIDAALGILTIVDANMVLATRMVSVERGYDPRDFTLVAFGGAGPLHAISIAAELGVRRVLVPESPGILCALGLLVTDMRADYVRTALGLTARPAPRTWPRSGPSWRGARQAGWPTRRSARDSRLLERTVDMRYLGQNYELPVPSPGGAWDEAAQAELERRFHAAHERTYGYAAEDEPIQLVNFRVTAYGLTPHIRLRQHRAGDAARRRRPSSASASVSWARGASPEPTPIYDRARLQPGHEIVGPAIVEQLDTTTLIGPGQHARLDEYRNLHIDLAPPTAVVPRAGLTAEVLRAVPLRGEQVGDRGVERLGQAQQRAHRQVLPAALDGADVRPIQTGLGRERLLAPAPRGP